MNKIKYEMNNEIFMERINKHAQDNIELVWSSIMLFGIEFYRHIKKQLDEELSTSYVGGEIYVSGYAPYKSENIVIYLNALEGILRKEILDFPRITEYLKPILDSFNPILSPKTCQWLSNDMSDMSKKFDILDYCAGILGRDSLMLEMLLKNQNDSDDSTEKTE